jgi:hypothetical protein
MPMLKRLTPKPTDLAEIPSKTLLHWAFLRPRDKRTIVLWIVRWFVEKGVWHAPEGEMEARLERLIHDLDRTALSGASCTIGEAAFVLAIEAGDVDRALTMALCNLFAAVEDEAV